MKIIKMGRNLAFDNNQTCHIDHHSKFADFRNNHLRLDIQFVVKF